MQLKLSIRIYIPQILDSTMHKVHILNIKLTPFIFLKVSISSNS